MATCSECKYMNLNNEHDNDGKFWCEEKLEWFRADDSECYRYYCDENRKKETVEYYNELSKRKQSFSSPCFITTIVCDTLGMDDNNMYLTLLRKFRKDYLQKKPDGIKVLEEYDTIGPIIAYCISSDEKREEVAQGVFIHSIIPVINDICEGKNMEAINKYTNMTKGLIHRYGLDTLTLSVPGVSVYDYNQDKTMMGHGKLVKRK